MIATAMPGKFGDALYAFPVIKYLAQQYGSADFYTATALESLRPLVEYQPYINKMITRGPEHGYNFYPAWGFHPADIPIDETKYDQVFQLGYHEFPDRSYVQFQFKQIGLEGKDISCEGTYEYPDINFFDDDYIVIAPRGDGMYKLSFMDIIEKSPVRVVQVGGKGESWPGGTDMTGLPWLETVSLLAKAKGFYGIISSQAAMAHNFSYPKVLPNHVNGWDQRHLIRSASTWNMVVDNPDSIRAEEILEYMGLW